MSKTEQQKVNFFIDYPYDVLESFIILIIIRAIVDKPIDYLHIFKSSLIIGALIFLATAINVEFRDNVKQGLHYGVSSMILTQFSSSTIM